MPRALERRGHEVHVFARIGEGQRVYDVIDGVHYHRVPIELNPDFVTEMTNMGGALHRRLVETEGLRGTAFDIVHGHDWLVTKGLVAAKGERARRIVMTYHSTELRACRESWPSVRENRRFEAEGAYVADRVVTSSAALANEVCWLYPASPTNKVRTIRNGIHCSWYDRAVDAGAIHASFRDRSDGSGGAIRWAPLVGRRSRSSFWMRLRAYCQHRPEAKVLFAGDGEMRGYLEQRGRRNLGIAGAVRFLGDPSDVIALYLSDGRGLRSGTTRVLSGLASSRHGPRESQSSSRTNSMCKTSCITVSMKWSYSTILPVSAGGSIRCLPISTRLVEMGERGRVKAAYGYSWDMIAGQTEGVYQELLG
ncbi:MAG: glycosyltransferase family 4 protein [Polyangiaceae bacterium]